MDSSAESILSFSLVCTSDPVFIFALRLLVSTAISAMFLVSFTVDYRSINRLSSFGWKRPKRLTLIDRRG